MGKNKPNAFSAFMVEYKRLEENKGRRFPGGMKQVQVDPKFLEAWSKLSISDKEHYKEIAKNSKAPKKTGTGELVEHIRRAQQQEEQFQENMLKYISNLVKTAKDNNAIADIKFFVIHINYFYSRKPDNSAAEYYPAEIAIGEFTLRNGMSRVYHAIVNETPKLGFSHSASAHSKETHQIPIEAPFGKNDYGKIFREICEFLGPKTKDGKYPPMFTSSTLDDIYTCAKSVLSRLAAACDEPDDFFTLYSFENLFSTICNSMDLPGISQPFDPVVASIELKKDPHAYRTNISCFYHETLEVGSVHCSQSLIQRWFITLRSFCRKPN